VSAFREALESQLVCPKCGAENIPGRSPTVHAEVGVARARRLRSMRARGSADQVPSTFTTGATNVKKKPTHQAVKGRIVRAVMKTYEQAYARDKVYQAKKPAVMKRIDAHVDRILRPLFT
jgi:hypothetical protein